MKGRSNEGECDEINPAFVACKYRSDSTRRTRAQVAGSTTVGDTPVIDPQTRR
jgi:hypothetical protein